MLELSGAGHLTNIWCRSDYVEDVLAIADKAIE